MSATTEGAENVRPDLNSIITLCQSGDFETAVRESGHMLALCDNELRRARNAGELKPELVADFYEAAMVHVRLLRSVKAAADAFSCVVTALLTLEVYGVSSVISAADKALGYYYAVCSFIDNLDAMGDATDEQDEAHRGYVLSYLASLLYHNYRKAQETGAEFEKSAEIYNFLKSIAGSNAIQSPTIRLGEKDVDPDTAGPLLVDILSRAAALGIYS